MDYQSLYQKTVVELRKIAKERGIRIPAGAAKMTIVQMILENARAARPATEEKPASAPEKDAAFDEMKKNGTAPSEMKEIGAEQIQMNVPENNANSTHEVAPEEMKTGDSEKPADAPVKRRGRPRKVRPEADSKENSENSKTENDAQTAEKPATPEKRRVGRPRKQPIEQNPQRGAENTIQRAANAQNSGESFHREPAADPSERVAIRTSYAGRRNQNDENRAFGAHRNENHSNYSENNENAYRRGRRVLREDADDQAEIAKPLNAETAPKATSENAEAPLKTAEKHSAENLQQAAVSTDENRDAAKNAALDEKGETISESASNAENAASEQPAKESGEQSSENSEPMHANAAQNAYRNLPRRYAYPPRENGAQDRDGANRIRRDRRGAAQGYSSRPNNAPMRSNNGYANARSNGEQPYRTGTRFNAEQNGYGAGSRPVNARPNGDANANYARPNGDVNGNYARPNSDANANYARPNSDANANYARPNGDANGSYARPYGDANANYARPNAEYGSQSYESDAQRGYGDGYRQNRMENGENAAPRGQYGNYDSPRDEMDSEAVYRDDPVQRTLRAQRATYDNGYRRQEIDGANLQGADFSDGAGLLEIQPDGYGFLRAENCLPGSRDVYISIAQIRRFGLKEGDFVEGKTRPQREGDRYSALVYINRVNGETPDKTLQRKPFEALVPWYPNERLRMENPKKPDISLRMIDIVAPIGKGQRGMIVSQPKAGKTTLLKKIANAISDNNPEVKLIVLLIDERPEEVTDMKRSIRGDVIYSTFDSPPENHARVSEMVLAHAQRLVESGKDVVILLDSITRLARAYNLIIPPTGRSLSGGLDPGALYKPKRFFGAARNIENGGSLTIIATALVDTGSRMDDIIFEEFKGTGNMELHLDRKLSDKRIFPAIDLLKSGTRREELLLTQEELDGEYQVRKMLTAGGGQQSTEQLISLMEKTSNNADFFKRLNGWMTVYEKEGYTLGGKSDR